MFYHTKIFRLKLSNKNNRDSDGFTLIELLMAIVVMGLTASAISFAVNSMMSSNQKLATEQNRRVEASRAIDLIANDVQISKIVSISTPPSGRAAISTLTPAVQGTPVLDMDVISSTAGTCADRIIYSVAPITTGQIGPNVLYRYGRISNANGTLDCTTDIVSTQIADAISINNLRPPECNAVSTPAANSTLGFYSCVNSTQASDTQQVSIALFSKLSSSKTYGVNRTVISGVVTDPTATSTDCVVPTLVNTTVSALTDPPTAFAPPSSSLFYHRINLDLGGSQVTAQTPSADSKLLCNKGLVSYTY